MRMRLCKYHATGGRSLTVPVTWSANWTFGPSRSQTAVSRLVFTHPTGTDPRLKLTQYRIFRSVLVSAAS